MARKVFFSFHYQNDSWRVNQVRNSWVTKGKANSFIDSAEWEQIQRRGKHAIQGWIDEQLHGTSVTVVLIGDETYQREWVLYELSKSYERGNGILGIHINKLKDRSGKTSGGLFNMEGTNPLDKLAISKGLLFSTTLGDVFPTYNWVDDDGYNNFEDWIEEAISTAITHRSRKVN